jgi:hypothetical protein
MRQRVAMVGVRIRTVHQQADNFDPPFSFLSAKFRQRHFDLLMDRHYPKFQEVNSREMVSKMISRPLMNSTIPTTGALPMRQSS